MKVVVIRFPDATDISALATGGAVSVKAGTVEIAGGTVNSVASMENPAADTLIPHSHVIPVGSIDLPATPIPGGATGPAVVT